MIIQMQVTPYSLLKRNTGNEAVHQAKLRQLEMPDSIVCAKGHSSPLLFMPMDRDPANYRLQGLGTLEAAAFGG